jgi:thiol-disulfide isomerase/thioredoxin
MPVRLALVPLVAVFFSGVAAATDELAPSDPYWTLVHDQAVVDDLKLSSLQKKEWREALDPLDLRCFPLRNRPPAEAEPAFAQLAAEAKRKLANVLKPQQNQRLEQIVIRAQGPAALLRDDLAAKLRLSAKQRAEIRQAIAEAREKRTQVEKDLRAAKLETAKAEQELTRLSKFEGNAITKALNDEQRTRLGGLYARDFDLSKLGRTAYKTPDLIAGSEAWVNGSSLVAEDLTGKVRIVHFFAFGCSNCIHNYPTYREWQKELAEKDVLLIGVHTPETKSEHNVETLKAKLKAEELHFPVLVDNDKANWNALGNSMWPSVYVIDKQGYMRAFWAGELKWQGATGDAQMRKQVEACLAEG